MRSLPFALTWEMLRHGRWPLIAAALAGLGFPLLIFAALAQQGGVDPYDPSMIIMHVVMIQFNTFVFGTAVLFAQGSSSRLFVYPAPSSAIVTWQMLPAMALMAIESVLITAILNAMFDVRWPLWGPALFVAVLLAAVQATMWLTERSIWLPGSVAAAALGLGFWFKSRYGEPFATPEYFWRTLTPGEVATLAGAAVLAYAIGWAGVARNRRGEAPLSLGVVLRLERLWDRGAAPDRTFAGPQRAQFWYEWRQKAWALPVTVAFGMTMAISIWAIFSRDLEELFGGFVAGGGMLSLAALVGSLVVGNTGSGGKETIAEMGSFLATRPMSTPDMARTILKNAAASVLVGWLLWAVGLLGVFLILWATERVPETALNPWGWAYVPATLLGVWTVMGLGASIGMAGRPYLLVKVLGGAMFTHIALVLFSSFALSPQAQAAFGRGVTIALAAAFLAGTVWAFVAAVRRALVGWPTVYVAASIWAGLTVMIVLVGAVAPLPRPMPLASGLMLIALAGLTVAPLATAPLALAWNRNR
jgi:hypothetical protein